MARCLDKNPSSVFERYNNPVGFALRAFYVERRKTDPKLDERNVISVIASEIGASAYTIRRWARQGYVTSNALTEPTASAFARAVGVPLEALRKTVL